MLASVYCGLKWFEFNSLFSLTTFFLVLVLMKTTKKRSSYMKPKTTLYVSRNLFADNSNLGCVLDLNTYVLSNFTVNFFQHPLSHTAVDGV